MLSVLSVVVVVAFERWAHVGLFRRTQYWVAMGIVAFFQALVDGWLTKLSAPIVIYNPEHHLGPRFPWDIPVEDYLFGFSMVTGAIVLWELGKRRHAAASDAITTAGSPDTHPTSTIRTDREHRS